MFSIIYIPFVIVGMVIFSLMASKRRLMKKYRRAISWYGKIIIHILPFPFVRVKYEDHSEGKEEGPFIIICNHRSACDAFLLAVLQYECIQVVNVWPFKVPVLGWGAKIAGYLSVKEMPFEEFSQKASQLIKEGVNVIAFPEGTRSIGNKLNQFYSSIFRVAIENKCSIMPFCMAGNEKVMPKGSGIIHPGTIKLRRLPAIKWEEYKNDSPFILKKRVRDILKNELEKMDVEL